MNDSEFTSDKTSLSLNLQHLLNMTDDTGMFQHCRYDIPDRNHGYTLDDNVRALIVAARSDAPDVLARLPIYVSFVMYCQKPDGLFRNFMGYDRQWLERVGSPDAQGRAIWSVGALCRYQNRWRKLGEEMLKSALPQLAHFHDLRAIAFSILGLAEYLQADAPRELEAQVDTELKRLTERLVTAWQETDHAENWHWFENFLTYENARLPQALFAAYCHTQHTEYRDIAVAAADFLYGLQFERGYLKVVGNQDWYYRTRTCAEFDEQPVDAGALVEMFSLAHRATGESRFLTAANEALAWYHGRNCHNLPLYDAATGACYDALTEQGVNLNRGAESCLSYYLAVQSMQKA